MAHFYKLGLILISPGMSNYNHYKVGNEITYPFPNFNGAHYSDVTIGAMASQITSPPIVNQPFIQVQIK